MSNPTTLVVKSLSIQDTNGRTIVDDVSFSVGQGEVLALIGESGSGKTSVALSILGFARPGMRISSGQITVDGQPLLGIAPEALRQYRGTVISLVPQNPTLSFSPRMTIGRQMAELLIAHQNCKDKGRAMINQALERVDLPITDEFLNKYPFQLSGGQLQRVAIGMAFITNPKVVVMDEPTTGLDVSTQKLILELIARLVSTSSASFVYVTHDLAVVNTLADSVAVMRNGSIVEQGDRSAVFASPTHDYTRLLLESVPQLPPLNFTPSSEKSRVQPTTSLEPPLLQVKDLKVFYGSVEAVHGVSFSIEKGECMALVGGSGSGKTTTGRCIAGLAQAATGVLRFEGRVLDFGVAARSRQDLGALQIVFQNPDRSLNPRESVAQAITRVLRLGGHTDNRQTEATVAHLLDKVHLPRRVSALYPSDLSGGERQRVAVARALAMKPRLLICDEITSALDVSVQAAVIDLLQELRKDGLAMLFITHNLPLVAEISQAVAIMKNGNIVEYGPTASVLQSPQSEYTRMLLAAVPRMGIPEGPLVYSKKTAV